MTRHQERTVFLPLKGGGIRSALCRTRRYALSKDHERILSGHTAEFSVFMRSFFRYFSRMLDWLQNSHADYVLAAYGIALAVLAGVATQSWRWARVMDRKARQIQDARRGPSS